MVWYFLMGEDQKKMEYCFFKNNQNYLLVVASGSLEVSHSFIDHSSSSFSADESLSLLNTSNTATETYRNQYFDSHHCKAEIPLPKQTLENTISRTNQETANPSKSLTLLNTAEKTLVNSAEETLVNTPEENTPECTFLNTPDYTQFIDSSTVFGIKAELVYLAIVVLIIGFVCILLLMCGNKQDITNESSSKSEKYLTNHV